MEAKTTRNCHKRVYKCDSCYHEYNCDRYYTCSMGCPVYIDGRCVCLQETPGDTCPHYKPIKGIDEAQLTADAIAAEQQKPKEDK